MSCVHLLAWHCKCLQALRCSWTDVSSLDVQILLFPSMPRPPSLYLPFPTLAAAAIHNLCFSMFTKLRDSETHWPLDHLWSSLLNFHSSLVFYWWMVSIFKHWCVCDGVMFLCVFTSSINWLWSYYSQPPTL